MEHSIYKNMIVLVVLLSVAAVMFEPVQTVPINDERASDLLRWKNFMITRKRDLMNRLLRDSRDAFPSDGSDDKKNDPSEFVLYSLAIDETIDLSNTAQMAAFIRGITAKFNIREESRCMRQLESMITRQEDLMNRLFLDGRDAFPSDEGKTTHVPGTSFPA
ncbi:Hypothetical predicted protein [Octopus vulgaris]|uniref:Uncharacterized protein n=1 Tax=Octopus vulgaris TaxID=6645 RepID=A0AA36BBJ0_OCTVU|nr:Hypothetical predicted protein [Octopus vulgaris]